MALRKLNHSPFRYPGGKFYARKLILEFLPHHDKYCEPFAGGASIYFSKPKVKKNILNDKDEELINTYIQIRDNVEEIINRLRGVKANKETHLYYKNEFDASNEIDRAVRWFYLNRTSYSGIMKKENCYFGYGDKYSMRPENWPNHLRTVSEKIQEVDFFTYDFEKLLKQKRLENFFLFIDPPYFNADQDKFYSVPFKLEDHYRLAEVLKDSKNNFRFLITYDNNNEIRRLYNWCHSIVDKEWNYMLYRTDDQKNGKKLEHGHIGERYKGKEIFITNYDPKEAIGIIEHKYDNQINLFSK